MVIHPLKINTQLHLEVTREDSDVFLCKINVITENPTTAKKRTSEPSLRREDKGPTPVLA